MKFIHDFDLVASLKSEHEDFDDVPKEEIIAAMQSRLNALKRNPDEIREAFGHVQTNEEIT